MSKCFFIHPMQSGKTTKAIYEFSKDTETTLFIVYNLEFKKDILNYTSIKKDNIVSQNNYKRKLIGIKYNTIIIDEYLLFNNKESLYNDIKEYNPDNIYIFSTPNKQYDSRLYSFIKKCKEDNIPYENMKIIYFNKTTKELPYVNIKDLKELYYNFITDSDMKIINNGFYEHTYKDKVLFKNTIGEKQFELEFENK